MTGYANPPKETQFKKGQSGNPKGRPKGDKNYLTLANRELSQKVSIMENGRHKTISKKEVFIKTAINKGIVGVSGVHIQRPMRCVFPRGHLHRQRTNQRSHGLVLISMALRF